MKKTWATLAVVASVPILTMGLIFLIATISQPSRILVAAALLVVGYVFINWGLLTLRRLNQISPEALATGIVELAKRLDGEVTAAQVQAEFSISTRKAIAALEEAVGRGDCERDRRDLYDVYVFKSVMPPKAIKRCPFCGSEFSIKSAVRECPNCGSSLEITKD
jgi:hypothetical protein